MCNPITRRLQNLRTEISSESLVASWTCGPCKTHMIVFDALTPPLGADVIAGEFPYDNRNFSFASEMIIKWIHNTGIPSAFRMSNTLGCRSAHWKAASPHPLPGTTTFAAQSRLPRLPVPELSSTLTQLKISLQPFADTKEELDLVSRRIDDFGRGIGLNLHERLVERAKQSEHWLEEWWDDTAYLAYRDSVHHSPSPSRN
jgi:hypothetical protein